MNKEILLDYINNKISFIVKNLEYIDFKFDSYQHRNYFKARVINIKNNHFILRDGFSFSDANCVVLILEENAHKLQYVLVKSSNFENWFSNKKINLSNKKNIGLKIKNNDFLNDYSLATKFESYKCTILNNFKYRKLSQFQLRDSFFLYCMERASNFSVPGSGKTTTCLATYSFLKINDGVKKLVIIGPKSCFKSWKDEYFSCFNKEVIPFDMNFFSNDIANEEKNVWIDLISKEAEMYFFNYESVGKNLNIIKKIITPDTLLIFDEIHKIKAVDGKWANSCKKISDIAKYRIALTGTPLPNGYHDVYNILQVLYSEEYSSFFKWNFEDLKNPKKIQANDFIDKLFPFFVRTTKKDLGIPNPNPDTLIEYSLTAHELDLYDKVLFLYKDNFLSLCIRLLQCLSCPNMLLSDISAKHLYGELDEEEKDDDKDIFISKPKLDEKVNNLVKTIKSTTKIEKIIELINNLYSQGKKVILWSIFLEPMYTIMTRVENILICKIINGKTKQKDRDSIINEFQNGKIDLLISNPQTIAESVSIHQKCHDAIYVDFSFNLVHMLQSKDRIHRFGISKDTKTNYYFFIPNNLHKNIDKIIYDKLLIKENKMLNVINSDNIYSDYDSKIDIVEEIGKELLST